MTAQLRLRCLSRLLPPGRHPRRTRQLVHDVTGVRRRVWLDVSVGPPDKVSQADDVPDLLGPPVALLLNPRPWMRPYAVWVGFVVSTISLLASSWCTTVGAVLSSIMSDAQCVCTGRPAAVHTRHPFLHRRCAGLFPVVFVSIGMASHLDWPCRQSFDVANRFVERRGFANGVCFSGTAVGGLVYPFVFNGPSKPLSFRDAE